MNHLPPDIQNDVEIINRISAITDILDVVCRTTGMGFATIARVTSERWVACAVKDEIHFGLLPGGELDLETTICHEVHQHHTAVVIDHVAEDDQYACHPTPLIYGFQSYISVPIYLKNGDFWGTLCAIDPKPAELTKSGALEMFTLFTQLISFHINATEELNSVRESLIEERKTAELREQFIAIVGHDLRNPVSAISTSATILQQMPLPQEAHSFLRIIRNSTYRMNGLIENILDFARGRMGGGMPVNRKHDVSAENLLTGVIAELQTVYPGKEIQTDFHLPTPLYCDEQQMAQLFSNLLSNAITHGDANLPVTVQASTNAKGFSLSVCNKGTDIPAHVMEHIFQPFYRGGNQQGKQGLGLGLYIASEIARAHGGTLTVSSAEQNICFLFQMPSSSMLPDAI